MILIQGLGIMELKQSRFAQTKIPGGLEKFRNPWMVQGTPVRLAALIIKLCVWQMYIQIIHLICRAVTEQVLVIKYL